MTDADFARLVDDVVRTAERFAEIDAGPGARRVAGPSHDDGTEPLTSPQIRPADEPHARKSVGFPKTRYCRHAGASPRRGPDEHPDLSAGELEVVSPTT